VLAAYNIRDVFVLGWRRESHCSHSGGECNGCVGPTANLLWERLHGGNRGRHLQRSELSSDLHVNFTQCLGLQMEC